MSGEPPGTGDPFHLDIGLGYWYNNALRRLYSKNWPVDSIVYCTQSSQNGKEIGCGGNKIYSKKLSCCGETARCPRYQLFYIVQAFVC